MKRSALLRRTPLASSSTLARSAPMARSRMKRRPRRARATDDPKRLAWMRPLPCCGPGCRFLGPCDPHHRTGAGMALKAADDEAMPLCRRCHDELHDGRGVFGLMTRDALRDWQQEQVAHYRALYAAHVAEGMPT